MEPLKYYNVLLDKSFYLDLKIIHQRQSLIADLKKLGGKVEEFFSKDVNYVVTDRMACQLSSSEVWTPSTPKSGLSVQSPLQAQTLTIGDLDSPSATSSPPDEKAKSSVLSRGQALVQQAARFQCHGTTDVLEVCKQWGIQILHVQKVIKWIQKIKAQLLKKKKQKELLRSNRISKFAHPYIKVEDVDRFYRPIYKLKRHWPELMPFSRNVAFSRHRNDIGLSNETCKENYAPNLKAKEKWRYCELCGTTYISLDAHLHTEKHQKYTSNSKNYIALHDVLTSFPTIEEFLLKAQNSKDNNFTELKDSYLQTPFQNDSLLPLDLSNKGTFNYPGVNDCTKIQPEFPALKNDVSFDDDDEQSFNLEKILCGKEGIINESSSVDYVGGSCITPCVSNDFPFLEDSMTGAEHVTSLVDIQNLQGDTSLSIPFLNGHSFC